MIIIQANIYTLPELTFVGGKTQELRFNLKDTKGNPYDVIDGYANFSVCSYSYKIGEPIFSIEPRLVTDESGVTDRLFVTITPDKTIDLYGKYIYQIIIVDFAGKVQIPNQGIMNITRNINMPFISSMEENNSI